MLKRSFRSGDSWIVSDLNRDQELNDRKLRNRDQINKNRNNCEAKSRYTEQLQEENNTSFWSSSSSTPKKHGKQTSQQLNQLGVAK